MIVIKFWQYVKGYKEVKAYTKKSEKLFNLLTLNKVYIWDVGQVDEKCVKFKILQKDTEKLIKVSESLNIPIENVKIYGSTKIKELIKKRKVFVLGCFCCLFILFSLSFFLWEIELYGLQTIKKEAVYSSLEELGIKEGKFIYNLDLDRIEKGILKNYPNITYINIEIKGTKAKALIKENQAPIKIYEKNQPIDLVAKEDGIILEITPYCGTPLVKAGEKVKKGQVLIASLVEYEKVGKKEKYYVHAMGKIITEKKLWSISFLSKSLFPKGWGGLYKRKNLFYREKRDKL